jgi:hypothetical protein
MNCPRCQRAMDTVVSAILAPEPIPDWNGIFVCAQCAWDSIPEQPPLPEARVQEIIDYATKGG